MRANRYLVVVCAGLETFIDLLQDVLHRYFTFGCVSVPLRAGRGKDCQEHIRCSPRSGNGTPAHVSQLLLLFFRVASHAFPLPYQRWLSGGSYALQWRGPWASVSMASRAHHELGIQSGRTLNLPLPEIRWKGEGNAAKQAQASPSARVPSARRRACHWRCLAAVSQRRRLRPPQLQLLPPRLVLRLRKSSHFVVASPAGWRALASQPRAPARSI